MNLRSGIPDLEPQETDETGIVGGSDRKAALASGRLGLSWQPTAEDFVQVSGFWPGESLLAQGTREAGGMVNLGYRRRLTDSVSFNFTGRDVFNSLSNTTVFETARFREISEQNINLRAFFVGLSWSFGSSQRGPPEQFDFSTGPTGPTGPTGGLTHDRGASQCCRNSGGSILGDGRGLPWLESRGDRAVVK